MEKPLKVMWNGKPLRDIYPHATRWQVLKFRLKRRVRQLMIVIIIGAIVWLVCVIYAHVYPATVILPPTQVIKEIEVKAPVLDRIAGCESQGNAKLKGTQWDKSGQVLMRSNTNKTVDVGKYQINSAWFQKATELGLDLTKETDNEAMAVWIYKNRGTGDWYASMNCWK